MRRRLGGSDLEVGAIAYGCWRLAEADVDAAHEKIGAALEAGWTLIDTADIYGWDGESGWGDAERLLGRVLAEAPALRERMVLATKGGIRPGVPYDWSPSYLRAACEASLERLGVERVDLYQLHRPDLLTPPEQTADALAELVARGLVRHLGVSNVTPAQFDLLQSRLELPLVTTQPEFSPWHVDPVQDGTFDHAARLGVTPLAWSPLGGGRVGADGASEPVGQALAAMATALDVDPATVALAFVLRHPVGAVPIIGTQSPDRIRAAAAALELELDRAQWYTIYQAAIGTGLP